MAENMSVVLNVNGAGRAVSVEPRKTLADAIREDLGLTGTHLGCEHGVCGACTILLDGEVVRSCLMLAVQADGAEITTIEGIADGDRPPPDAKRILRVPRPAVRLLHAGDDPGRDRRGVTEP